MKRVRRGFMVMVLGIAMVVAACGGGASTTAQPGPTPSPSVPKGPVELVVAYNVDATGLDPHDATAFSSSMVLSMHAFDTLVQLELNGFQPRLAESWTVADGGLSMIFKLRQGVVFHDGTPFNAEAAAFNFQRMVDNPKLAQASKFTAIKQLEVVDQYTLKVKSDRPLGLGLLGNMAHPSGGAMQSPTALKAEKFAVGTGPFKLISWTQDDKLAYEAFDQHWEGRPKIDKLTIKIVPEGSARNFQLETKEIDVNLSVQPEDLAHLKANKDLTVVMPASSSWRYVGFNVQHKPFDNVKVRQALNYAVNKQAIIDTVLFGAGKVLTSPVGSGMVHHAAVGEYKYDPAKAKQLLTEVGFPNGFKTKMITSNRSGMPEVVQAIAGYWKAVGVEVEISVLEQAVYLQQLYMPPATTKVETFLGAYGSADPDGLRILLHSKEWSPRRNSNLYANPVVDRLLEQGQSEMDPAKRSQTYKEIFQLVWEEAPWVFLDEQSNVYAWNNSVSGVKIYEANQRLFDFRKAEKK